LVLVAIGLTYRQQWGWLTMALGNWRVIGAFCATAFLLLVNWLTYIWAVHHNHIVDSSLGYYMTPLVNVLLGVVFLRERLRPWQRGAIFVACMGVLYLALNASIVPWVGLTLAFSFSGYALLKKMAQLDALEGLFLETSVLSIPAVAFLFFREMHGVGEFVHGGIQVTMLLFSIGVITAVPLLLFAASARRIPLSTLGVLQYLTPTIQFLIGVLLYGEAMTPTRLIGFSLIWLALLIYSCESLFERQRKLTPQFAQ
jgi:chloramphenicol-sensitive protein RarD